MKKLLIFIPILFLFLIEVKASLYSLDEYTSLYLPFDDCVGTNANDISPLNNDGTLINNPNWLGYVNCISGCCLSFDGINDYVSILDSSSLDLSQNITIAFWYKSETGTQHVLQKGYGTIATEPNYAIKLEPPFDNEFSFRDGITLRSYGSSNVADDKLFHCFVVTRNSSLVMIYNDKSVSFTGTSYTMNINNNPLIIGYGSATDYANFTIDELMIENATVNSTWVNSYCDNIPDTCALCGTWVSTHICQYGYEQFTRTCPIPSCTNTSYWIQTTYCAYQYNISQGIYEQRVKTYSDCISVDSGLVRPFDVGVLRKDVSIAIPLNCSSNVMTNSSFNLYVSASDSVFRTNKNNFTETICNPLTSCDKTTTYVCEDAYYSNLTWNKNSDSYISGDIAKASFIVEGYPCKVSSNFFGYEGWVKYGIIGSLCYSCDLNCGGHKCETVGLVDYSYVENPDCSVNASSRIECINECDLTTGTCSGATTTQQQTQDALNPTNWINALIHPNANTKLIIGLALSFGLGILGLYLIGNTVNNSIVFAIGFSIGFIIFSFAGWIPIVFSIIIVFMVAIVGLLKFIK